MLVIVLALLFCFGRAKTISEWIGRVHSAAGAMGQAENASDTLAPTRGELMDRIDSPSSPSLIVRGATAEDLSRLVEEHSTYARVLFDAGNFRGAADQYDDALALDPRNHKALLGLEKSIRHDQQLGSIRTAFEGQDYYTALRLLYRLGPNIDPEVTTRYRANSWMNLSLVALRARRCDDAAEYLDEALRIRPDDEDALWLVATAERCRKARRYALYFAELDQVGFRQLTD